MTYIAACFAAWCLGYALGFQIKQIRDALMAA